MKQDIILAGVGGQGILTIAYLLDNVAVAKGLRFKQAEVHGMAQRGGAVYSHLRFSDREVISDLVPDGSADMILSVEPLEVQRYLSFLRPGGVVVASDQPHKNIPDYPEDSAVIDALLSLPRAVLVDSRDLATRGGAPKAENVAMVGAATAFLPFAIQDYEPPIRDLFGAKGDAVVAANLAVLEAGFRVGAFWRGLLDAGARPAAIFPLMRRLDPGTIDPAMAGAFARALAAPGAAGRVASLPPGSACSVETARSLA